MSMDTILVSLHVAANLVWVGSVLAGVVALRAPGPDAASRQAIARRIFGVLALPAFVASLVLGAARLGLDWRYYMVTTHFMHAKLSLALVAIVAHHWMGARLRRAGATQDGAIIVGAVVFGLSCMAAVVMAVARPI